MIVLYRAIFLFDRKIPFLSNKKIRLCALARRRNYCPVANAPGAGVRQGAHFFIRKNHLSAYEMLFKILRRTLL